MQSPRIPWVTAMITMAMTSLYIVAGPVPEAWVYDRAAVLDGELWRLLTGHLVHSDLSHLSWNLAGTLVLGCLLERTTNTSIAAMTLVGAIAIALLLLWQPTIAYYCGFSGLLNTWLASLLIYEYQDNAMRPMVVVTALGVLAKLVYEWQTGNAIFTDTTWPSLPEAHLTGLIAGICWWVVKNKFQYAFTAYAVKKLKTSPDSIEVSGNRFTQQPEKELDNVYEI